MENKKGNGWRKRNGEEMVKGKGRLRIRGEKKRGRQKER